MIFRHVKKFLFVKPASFSSKPRFHTHYDPKSKYFIEFNTLKTLYKEADIVKLNDYRIKGTLAKFKIYDTHRLYPNIKYNQGHLPTVLIIPSGEHVIDDYDVLIGELVKDKYRVIAFQYPGFEETKFLTEEKSYKNSPLQKDTILRDLLSLILFNRIIKLDSVIVFNENCYLFKDLLIKSDSRYIGHNSLIMVNPTIPIDISKVLKSKFINGLQKFHLDFLYESSVIKAYERNEKKILSAEEKLKVVNLVQAWSHVDDDTIDILSNIICTSMNSQKLYFLEENPFYDKEFNDKVYDYFKDMSRVENLHKIPIELSSKDMSDKVQMLRYVQTKIADECKLFIKQTNKV